MSLKDNLYALKNKRLGQVEIDGSVYYLKMLSAKQAVAYSEFNASGAGTLACMTRLLVLILANEDGSQLVPLEEEANLADLPIGVIRELFEKGAAFNRLGEEAVVEETKN